MDVYVVLLRDDEGRDEHGSSFVREAFPKARPFGTSGWILATELGTCDEVLKELKVDKDLDRPHWSGLVVRLDDYGGYAERSLWKTLRGWQKVLMEAKDNIVRYPKTDFTGDDRVGDDRGNRDGERLARLEVHLRHVKENSATKEDIATVNGRLDTVAEAIKNLVTKDDLLANRRWLTGTIIAMGTLLFVALAALVAVLGYVNPALPQGGEPSRFATPSSDRLVPSPPIPPPPRSNQP